MTYKFNRKLQDKQYLEQSYKLYGYIDKQDFRKWEWAEEILPTRYSRSYSISLMIILVTELQFNILLSMKRLSFATD